MSWPFVVSERMDKMRRLAVRSAQGCANIGCPGTDSSREMFLVDAQVSTTHFKIMLCTTCAGSDVPDLTPEDAG